MKHTKTPLPLWASWLIMAALSAAGWLMIASVVIIAWEVITN